VVDEKFHSVSIANKKRGVNSILKTLLISQLKGHTFTFWQRGPTFKRLMPSILPANVQLNDQRRSRFFPGDHDKTTSNQEGVWQSVPE